MQKQLLAAGVATAALMPSVALAQQTCEQRSANRAVGAVAGNQLSRGSGDCARAYGYYDDAGRWRPTTVAAGQASGYYDRGGAWVQGAPNGHYDAQGRWAPAQADRSVRGYYADGRWTPASADGYYGPDGRWLAGAAPGHYDRSGRWIAGPAVGHYDSRGRWTAAAVSAGQDSAWSARAQPGYYQDGRWRAGPAHGYYDAQGRWQPTAASADERPFNANDRIGADWVGAPREVLPREAWLRGRIERGLADGALHRRNGDRALQALSAIRRDERGLRHHGGDLGRRDEFRMQARLDDVSASLRWSPPQEAPRY